MHPLLTAPLFTILVGLPGIFHGFGVKQIRSTAPRDTIPPVWKSASRLALEDQFVFARLPSLGPRVGLKVSNDPRILRVGVDPDSGSVSTAAEFGEVPLGFGHRQQLGGYAQELSRLNFQRLWADRSRQQINSLGAAEAAPTPRSGLSFQFPSPLPQRVQSLLGPGGPALNVSGSENIRLSGQSNWSNQQIGPLGQKRSLFPSLDMQQDLNIQLEGQLSDRIRVNLLQNSANQIPLANRIAINYKGDEDDLIQELDLGNTNLSLPGTQYVSYSGKNEGLFGIKAASRLGPLDMTVLASKQEGRSERATYAGGASRQTQTLRDLEYVRGVYFFLYDPNRSNTLDINESSIRVYLDDANYGNDVNTVRGRALVDPTIANPDSADTVSVRGSFQQLNPGADQDYEVLRDVYGPLFRVIRVKRPLVGEQRLAVTYDARDVVTGDSVRVGGQDVMESDGQLSRRMKLLRAPASVLRPDPSGNYDTTGRLDVTRDLELKNFYQLPGQRIDPGTLKIAIRKGVDDPPVTSIQTPQGGSIPYLEVLGLDNLDETTGIAVKGHDGKVDGNFVNSNTRVFVDYENGILFFFDLRPFAPRIGPQGKPFDQALSNALNRRDSLVGGPQAVNAANPTIYDKYNVQRDLDAVYFIDVDFTAARASGEITLGRGNIIEGSDVVTINGQALARDRDYTIDYDLGRITLRRQLGPADQLNVDYSYAPLFQQAGRTLIGSAFSLQGRDKSFGGAFMYESKGAQDLRPRLGEEPSRSLISDLNTDWSFKPDWMTRMVDRLPGVRTTTPSEFRVQAEVGASFPNPNTRNEVYIDDMEGVRDAVTLSMDAQRWRWSSVPSRPEAVMDQRATVIKNLIELQDQGQRIHNAEIHWYSPYSVVKERDLKPTLTDAQGAQNSRQVLALSIPRRPLSANNDPANFDTLWAGLTYPLDQSGIDLSKSQFIELWVNDWNDEHVKSLPSPRVRGRHVKLHIDLGVVSEDQMRSPDARPNHLLDTEDKGNPPDNQLVVAEDVGYDGWNQQTETDSIPPPYRDLVTAGPGDPEGDDFHTPNDTFKEIDPRRYVSTNGTDGNRTINPVPDTEDLNLNNNLDTQEDYFEYTIDLGDPNQPYLVSDLQREFHGNPNVPSDNGWRRYRIPIADSLRVQFGVPNLTLARHVRVWIEGVTRPDPSPDSLASNPQRPLLMLGSLDIIGSRWRTADLDTVTVRAGSTETLNSVNTVDNADIYESPFDPGETRNGSQGFTRREQSMALEFTQLGPGTRVEAFKTFSLDENYSRYGKLNWFVVGYNVHALDGRGDADSLAYFVRFASDEQGRSYYEYRAPLPAAPSTHVRRADWTEVRLDLTELSNLKLNSDFPSAEVINYARPRLSQPSDTLIVNGRPSFTRLRRVSFGLINRSTGRSFDTGQLWFNELRATDVAKDRGTAERVLVNGRFANLLSYNMTWNGRDADFLSVGENRGTGNTANSIAMGGNLDLHRFFEGTGIVLPISFNFGQNTIRPRFSAGDDVVRTGPLAQLSETFSDSRNWGASYSRNWSDRSNRFLLYTLGGITANINTGNNHGRSPSGSDVTRTLSAAVNYQIAPRSIFSFAVPGTKARIFPLPERFYWNYRIDRRQSFTADRVRETGVLVPREAVDGRAASINFGADTRPIEAFHHHFEGVRNLTVNNPEHWRFINFGRVVSWSQAMDAHYTVNAGSWVKPTLTWGSRYTQDNRPELSPDLSLRAIGNGQSVTMRWDLPFDTALPSGAALPDSARKRSRGFDVRGLLAHLGTISTDAGVNWQSAFSRLTGRPSFLYLIGLTGDPGLSGPRTRVYRAFGNQSSKGFDWRTSARTRIALGLGASLQTQAELTSRISTDNDVDRRQDVVRFPDIQVDYGRVADAIQLSRLLQNAHLTTAYNRSQTTNYNNSRDVKSGIATSSQWQPLLKLTGDLKNGTRLELSVERRNTESKQFQLGSSITTDQNTDINFSINRSFTQGQKVNFLGRESTIKSTVNLGLNAAYSRQKGETKDSNDPRPRYPTSKDRLSVNGTGSYGFSSNVTGNVTLGFGQDRDLTTDIVHRNIRIELRASFTF